ncbi:hypothetical protein BD414DRAFT_501575 [Trametes punicea]|nr:hypothetical protein BD414DRAFT_501575 [Trametes punicea]
MMPSKPVLARTLQADDPVIGVLLGLLGVVVDAVDTLLGIQCSPIKIVALGPDPACSANVVCCENNSIMSFLHINQLFLVSNVSFVGRPHLHWLHPYHPLSAGCFFICSLQIYMICAPSLVCYMP